MAGELGSRLDFDQPAADGDILALALLRLRQPPQGAQDLDVIAERGAEDIPRFTKLLLADQAAANRNILFEASFRLCQAAEGLQRHTVIAQRRRQRVGQTGAALELDGRMQGIDAGPQDPLGARPMTGAPEASAISGKRHGATDMFLRRWLIGTPGRKLVSGDIAGIVEILRILGIERIPVSAMAVFDNRRDALMRRSQKRAERRILREEGEDIAPGYGEARCRLILARRG